MKAERDEQKDLNEAFDEIILHDACELYLNESNEYEELLRETLAAGPHQFSKRHEKQMKKLIASVGKKKRTHISRRRVRWIGIAAAVSILFFGASGLSLVTHANWEDIRSFFLRRETTHTEIVLPEDIGEEYRSVLQNTGWERAYYPSYLPSGFVLCDVEATLDSCLMTFECQSSKIIVFQSALQVGNFAHVDTEDANKSFIEINGYDGEYIEKGNDRTIYFKTEEHFLSVKSNNISKSQLVKVTKNLKMIENAK